MNRDCRCRKRLEGGKGVLGKGYPKEALASPCPGRSEGGRGELLGRKGGSFLCLGGWRIGGNGEGAIPGENWCLFGPGREGRQKGTPRNTLADNGGYSNHLGG